MAVYIRSLDGSTIIGMDAVEVVSYERSANVTTSTIFNGARRSDHVHSNLPVISFNGVVTTTKVRNTYPSPRDFRKALDTLIDSYELLSFFGTRDGAIPDLNRCYLTSFNVTRDTDHGDSLLASVTLQQLDINDSLQATTLTVPAQSTEGQLAGNPNNASEGTKTENTQEVRSTIARRLADSGIEVIGDIF